MNTQKQIVFALMLTVLIGAIATAQTRVSPQSDNQQSEPFIAVNPTDPNNLIIVAISFQSSVNRIGAYYTTDGGQNWSVNEDILGSNLPGKGAGDPMIAFDGSGVAYCLYQVQIDKKLYLQKSSDGGTSWSAPNAVYTAQSEAPDVPDRPWLIAGENPNAWNAYDVYFTVTDEPVVNLCKSVDSGAQFSTSYIFEAGSPHYHGSTVGFGPSGEIYVAYAEYDPVNLNPTLPRGLRKAPKIAKMFDRNGYNFNIYVKNVEL